MIFEACTQRIMDLKEFHDEVKKSKKKNSKNISNKKLKCRW